MEYTCKEYRQEMLLLALRKRLNDPHLSEKEKQEITADLRQLEVRLQLD